MYAQNSILCQFGNSAICPNFANPYLTQFSSVSGGNCIKDPTSLEDYLGGQIVQSDDGKKAWLGQPTIIMSLEKQFGERVAKKKMTVTPGTPGFIGGKVDDISKVDEKTQSMYRSGVGTLLYLTKHSRPDITNPVRELSKSMDGASMAQVTEMYRVINCVLETKTLGLRMVPIFNDGFWKLEALSDSDFANDKDTRYSVYGEHEECCVVNN